jgi:Methylamine utilisation protein MauE
VIALAGTLAYWARCTVSIALIMSALWKLRHQAEFSGVLGAVFRQRFRLLRLVLSVVVPVAEMAVAGVILLPGAAGVLGSALAGALVFTLSATMLRHDLTAGCGCWSGPHPSRAAVLARNGLLIALVAGSVASQPALSWRLVLPGIAIGGIFAFLIMEIPVIGQYFADAQGVAP